METKLTKQPHARSTAETDSERTWLTNWLIAKMASLNDFFHVLGGSVAYVLMIALFVVGFWEIGKGIYIVFLGNSSVPEGTRESAALEISLKGLEFLFLAPLTYLTLLSLE